jgi:hypothetical protein
VRLCIERNDITWFPMNKALKLTQAETALDILERDLNADIASTEAQLTENLKNMQLEADVVLSQLRQAVKADVEGVGAKVAIGRALIQMSRSATNRINTGPGPEAEMEGEDDDNESVDGGANAGIGGNRTNILINSKLSMDSSFDMGKHVFLVVESVSGFDSKVTQEELLKISCCVVCDINMYSIKCESVHKGNAPANSQSIKFKMGEPLVICSNAEATDDRRCLIQVLDMQGMFGAGGSTASTPHGHSHNASSHALVSKAGKLYGKVEFDMDELIQKNGELLSKPLLGMDGESTDSGLMLHIRPSFVVATDNVTDEEL